MRHKMKRIQSKLRKIGTYDVCKISLSCFDDKRYILDDGINTLAYFHKGTFQADKIKFLIPIIYEVGISNFLSFSSNVIISFIISFSSYFKSVNNLSISVSLFNNISSLFLTSSFNLFISFILTFASSLNSISSSICLISLSIYSLMIDTLVHISNYLMLHFFQFVIHLTVFLLLLFHLFPIL